MEVPEPRNSAEFRRGMLDLALKQFEEALNGVVEKTALFHDAGKGLPPDYDKVLSFLSREGYLDEDARSFKITHKGRMVLDEGGFLRKYRREVRERTLTRIGILVGIVCGLSGLILSIVALAK